MAQGTTQCRLTVPWPCRRLHMDPQTEVPKTAAKATFHVEDWHLRGLICTKKVSKPRWRPNTAVWRGILGPAAGRKIVVPAGVERRPPTLFSPTRGTSDLHQ